MFSSTVHCRHCSMSIRGLYTVCARKTFPTPSCCHHFCSVITTSDGSSDLSLHQEWSSSRRILEATFPPLLNRFDASVLIIDVHPCPAPDNTDTHHVFLAAVVHFRPESLSCRMEFCTLQPCRNWMGFARLCSIWTKFTPLLWSKRDFHPHFILYSPHCAWKLLQQSHHLYHTPQSHDA